MCVTQKSKLNTQYTSCNSVNNTTVTFYGKQVCFIKLENGSRFKRNIISTVSTDILLAKTMLKWEYHTKVLSYSRRRICTHLKIGV